MNDVKCEIEENLFSLARCFKMIDKTDDFNYLLQRIENFKNKSAVSKEQEVKPE